eukprot:1301568-Alexandrium_andersonii.AAC.1
MWFDHQCPSDALVGRRPCLRRAAGANPHVGRELRGGSLAGAFQARKASSTDSDEPSVIL